MSTFLFSEELRQELEVGKYTKWATELSEASLGGLLWMVGEFGERSRGVLELLDKHKEEIHLIRRGRYALKDIRLLVMFGENLGFFCCSGKFYAQAPFVEFKNLPEVVRVATEKASPQTKWAFAIISEEGFVVAGKDQLERCFRASVTKEGKVTWCAANMPMFSKEFRRRLKLGKYTRWATDFSEADLQSLLWMLGEFGYRSDGILYLLDKHTKDVKRGHELFRARAALQSLSRIVLYGERFDIDEARRKIRRRRWVISSARSRKG